MVDLLGCLIELSERGLRRNSERVLEPTNMSAYIALWIFDFETPCVNYELNPALSIHAKGN